MKKVVLSVLLLLVSIGSAFSQFDVQLSQYMFHISSFNPAAVGEGDMIHIMGQDRMQWLGFPNAGRTFIVSMNSPMKIGNTTNGIGVTFMNDQVGQFITKSAHLQYAYKLKLGSGVLSMGADLGFVSIGFNNGDSIQDPSHIIPIGDYHKIADDPLIPKSSVTGFGLDINVGALYSTPTYFAGLSYSHLNNPTVTWGDKMQFREPGTVYLTGGYNLLMADTRYVFKPSTLLKTDFSTWQLDLTARMEYNNKYWGGLSYRYQEAVVFLAGTNISGGLSVGVSYDLPVFSQIITVSPGSLEFLAMYDLQYVFGKRTSKYKSIRIL